MIGMRNQRLMIPVLSMLMMLSPIFAGAALAQNSQSGTFQSDGKTGAGLQCRIDPIDLIHEWNDAMLEANAIDHTPVLPGENRVFGEQFGPNRTARAFAIVQIAVFDAVNAIDRSYESFTGFAPGTKGKPQYSAYFSDASMEAAISQAAHDTLVALYPSQAEIFDDMLAEDLLLIPDGGAKKKGICLGGMAARAILSLREDDGSQHEEPVIGVDYFTSILPGKWRQDPISENPVAMGAYWGEVKPFVMRSSSQFRVPPPPPLTSFRYTSAYHEVKSLGGDGIATPTTRTQDQTIAGIFWCCDGTPLIGTPPRMYNKIALEIADQMGSDAIELARLLALVNVAIADGAISSFESKYYYDFWRPITGIRESDRGTGPTGIGDRNHRTKGDPAFSPLGSQASNTSKPNFTPPFPSYPAGHSTLGSACFQTLRNIYRTDYIEFTFVSDEFNGVTRDNTGKVRPLTPRTFPSLSAAEYENGMSRIYIGVHWSFDNTEGIVQGRRIANYIFMNAFRPLK